MDEQTATALAAPTPEDFARLCELPRMAVALYVDGSADVVNVSHGPNGVEVEAIIGSDIGEQLMALIDAEDFRLSWRAHDAPEGE